MGHEKTARVKALEEEVVRLLALVDELVGRYQVAYVTWELSGRGPDECTYALDLHHQYVQARISLKKTYDLLHECKAELDEK